MRRFVDSLVRQKGIKPPAGYKTSISICRAFLNQHAPKKAAGETLGKLEPKPVSPAQMYDIDARSSAFVSMIGGNKAFAVRKEPANYWFDRRHVEQFDVRVQSFRTVEGEVLTLLRVLDPKMIEIYG